MEVRESCAGALAWLGRDRERVAGGEHSRLELAWMGTSQGRCDDAFPGVERGQGWVAAAAAAAAAGCSADVTEALGAQPRVLDFGHFVTIDEDGVFGAEFWVPNAALSTHLRTPSNKLKTQ